jgi:hypothetical protein
MTISCGMHPRLTELFAELDRELAALHDIYAAVPPGRRMTRPAPDRWSAAEIIAHLAIVEGRIAKRIGDALDAGPVAPETDSSPILPSINRNRIVDRGSKRSAPEATHPIDVDPGTAWDALLRARETFKATALRGDGLALGTVTAPHPAFGPITLYEWIAFVGYHGARHGAQIAENEAALTAD